MKENSNILKNRELLYELLKQIDVLNTIYGGSVEAKVEIIGEIDKIRIKIFAPTISVESFSIMLNFSQLTVSIFPKTVIKKDKMEGFFPVFTPFYLKTFEIPSFVDLERIKAVHEDNDLVVTLPFKYSSDKLLRMIEIVEM